LAHLALGEDLLPSQELGPKPTVLLSSMDESMRQGDRQWAIGKAEPLSGDSTLLGDRAVLDRLTGVPAKAVDVYE